MAYYGFVGKLVYLSSSCLFSLILLRVYVVWGYSHVSAQVCWMSNVAFFHSCIWLTELGKMEQLGPG